MAMRRPAAAPRSASPAFSNCGAAQRCNEQQSQGICSASAPSAEALADFQSSCNPVGSLAEPGTLNAKPGSASSAAPTDAAAVSEFASLRKADLMARAKAMGIQTRHQKHAKASSTWRPMPEVLRDCERHAASARTKSLDDFFGATGDRKRGSFPDGQQQHDYVKRKVSAQNTSVFKILCSSRARNRASLWQLFPSVGRHPLVALVCHSFYSMSWLLRWRFSDLFSLP